MGLVAIGQTKMTSFINFYYFYRDLGPEERKTIGDAFKKLFFSVDLSKDVDRDFYGLTLLGDPTLSLDPPRADLVAYRLFVRLEEERKILTYISCRARVNDGVLTQYSLRSSRDGDLISGYLPYLKEWATNFLLIKLSYGWHRLYFKVKDDKGRWSSEDSQDIDVPYPP
jgi:hypothetical protein